MQRETWGAVHVLALPLQWAFCLHFQLYITGPIVDYRQQMLQISTSSVRKLRLMELQGLRTGIVSLWASQST